MNNSEDPSDVNNIILFYQRRRETFGPSALNGEPYLLITEQPKEKYRLRYESEITTTQGELLGRSSEERRKKFYPTVKLMNFNGVARISLTLYTVPSETNGRRYIHYQRLIKKKDKESQDEPHYVNVGPDNNYTAVFDHMGIIHLPKKFMAPELAKKKLNRRIAFCGENIKMNEKLKTEIKSQAEMEVKYIDPNIMCLCFEAFTVNQKTGCVESLCEPVFSEPIKNAKSVQTNDLNICRMHKNTSSVVGNEEIFMLVEKVAKRNIAIKFYELDDSGNEVWCDYGIFCEKDVHRQYAITFRTPPYRNLNIERDVTVLVALYRRTDGECSEPLQFRYRPRNISSSCQTDVTNDEKNGAVTVIPTEHESRNEEFNNTIVPYANTHWNTNLTGSFPGNHPIPAASGSCQTDVTTDENNGAVTVVPTEHESRNEEFNNTIVPYANTYCNTYLTASFPGNHPIPAASGSCQTDVTTDENNGAVTVIPTEHESRNEEFNNTIVPYANTYCNTYLTASFPGNHPIPAASGSCQTDVTTDENNGAVSVIPTEHESRNEEFNNTIVPYANTYCNTYLTASFPGNYPIPAASDINTSITSSSSQSSHLQMEAETSNIITYPLQDLDLQEIYQMIYWNKENLSVINECRFAWRPRSNVLRDTRDENLRRSVDDNQTTLKTINADIAADTSSHLEKGLKDLQIRTDFEKSIQNKNKKSRSLMKESLNEETTTSDQGTKGK